jgi:hypothetical protein
MFGLMVLGAVALYLALMFFVVRRAWRRGRANGGSLLKASAFAVLGFLLVYLPVFWNHIPVLLAHRSMCAKDAGFKAHIEPDRWRALNSDEISRLSKKEVEAEDRKAVGSKLPDGFMRYLHFGELLASEQMASSKRFLAVDVDRIERRLRDMMSGQVLSTYVDYSIGGRDDIRLWIFPKSCFDTNSTSHPLHQSTYFQLSLKEGLK